MIYFLPFCAGFLSAVLLLLLVVMLKIEWLWWFTWQINPKISRYEINAEIEEKIAKLMRNRR